VESLLSWLLESGIDERLRTLLRKLFIAPLQGRPRAHRSELLHREPQR
jgi:hypothetical protein